ncbi:glycosyltransferase family 4 protein [Algoriphagus lutimaris]|uniref:glycosyltransferase family 4 protein n=1 Tax=Algoriphagus lutimaris TaxID=613197 RepID=UPI00196B09D2|nr:glycosyltransferase [Algoriphagus lutimaris]MBN3518753.1 glycosyltransferase family 4 protein [Algoriphagus lutimaris]
MKKKKKILFLPKYPRQGASSRLRTFQYLDLWKQQGVEVSVSSFFNSKYLSQIYQNQKPQFINVLKCYLKRCWVLMYSWRYDLIWIEKEAFPFLPSYAEWLIEKLGKGYIVDYDDAVFHNYDQNPNWLVRTWMGNKIDWVMRHSRIVFVGNSYLGKRAKLAGALDVQILPTVVETTVYSVHRNNNNSKIRLGWIGSPSTTKYLNFLTSIFEELSKTLDFELLIINSPHVQLPDFTCEYSLIPWKEEEESSQISQFDIGMMPLPDSDWEKGKCAYKLIQYMACGLPVVASPVGMNKDVVRPGENGFLASTELEWLEALSLLISDSSLRVKMGDAGRKLVENEYSLEKNFEKIKRAVEGVFHKGR